jgi:hypothetical protein
MADELRGGVTLTPEQECATIRRLGARDPDYRVSYTLGELERLLNFVADQADTEAFLRGRKNGLWIAKMETRYGTMRGHLQRILAVARSVDGYAELTAALAAYDAFIAAENSAAASLPESPIDG